MTGSPGVRSQNRSHGRPALHQTTVFPWRFLLQDAVPARPSLQRGGRWCARDLAPLRDLGRAVIFPFVQLFTH